MPIPGGEIPGGPKSCYEHHGQFNVARPFEPCKPWEQEPHGTLNWTSDNCDTVVAGCVVREDVENTAHRADFSQAWFRTGTLHDGVTEMISMHPTRVNMPAEDRMQMVGNWNREVCVYAVSWPWLDEQGNQVAIMGNQVDTMQFHNVVGHPVIMTQELKDSLEGPDGLPADTFTVGCQYWVFGRMTARKVETWLFSPAPFCSPAGN